MAARVLLLSVLITEVLKPSCAAGVEDIGRNISGKNISKLDSSDAGPSKGVNSSVTFEIQSSSHIIIGENGTTLNCIAGSNKNVSWYCNGRPVPPCCGLIRCDRFSNGSLHFYDREKQKFKKKKWNSIVNSINHKKNEYYCVTYTNLGGLIRSASTFVQIAEIDREFKESPENITVREGEIVRLSCLIRSIPFPPNITWQHNETLLSYHNESKYSLVPPGVLYISTTKLSDAGLYRCIVTNEFLNITKTSREAKLTVISSTEDNKSHIPSSLFPQNSYNHSLLNGSNLNLVCAASGFPPSLVTWSFIPQDNDNVTQPHILLNSTNGISTLSLINVNVSNAGIYSCSSKDLITNDSELQNITVNILTPPSFVIRPTTLLSVPNGITGRLVCQAKGFPVPQMYWLKNSKNISIGGRMVTYDNITITEYRTELVISSTIPSDSGIYQCVAVNSLGKILAAGRLQVNLSRNRPASVISLKCDAVSPVKIRVSWELPKSLLNSSIAAYITVHYIPVEGGKEEISSPESGNITFIEITKDLKPFTNYSIYARVYNNFAAGDQSPTILCSTAPSVPTSAPKMNVDIISSTKLNVSWEPLTKKEARGIVTGYKLQWKLHQQSSIRVHYLSATIENYILSGLEPGAQYDLQVLAKTDQGWPNISEAQLEWITTTMPSESISDVDIKIFNVNSSMVKMKWEIKFKEKDQIELKFDSWQIYCENQDGKKLRTMFLSQNITEYLFTNLDMNVSYTMGLCMVNSSEVTSCLTKQIETTQSNRSNVSMTLEAIPVSSTSINLRWTLSDAHSVDSFELCYHAVHVQNSDGSKCFTIIDTEMNVDKLKPFTLYQFKVTANRRDANQTNFYSESIECYTNEDVPDKVEDVRWFLDNNSKVRITWEKSSNVNGVIQNYFVKYTMDPTESTMTQSNVTVAGNKTWTFLPGLVPGKQYSATVQAATKAGYGKASDPVIIIIDGLRPAPSDTKEPPQNIKHNQNLGVILGVSISVGFIIICLCSIYCRRKFENSRSLRNDTRPMKRCVLSRNGNGCCVQQSSASVSQQVNTVGDALNEIELAVLCPTPPIETNPHSDAKGTQSNGIFETCAKEPLLSFWKINGGSKDIRILENPQYKRRGSSTSNNQQEEEQDLEGTQLTIVNCTLGSSTSSLNNNSGCPDGEISSPKVAYVSVLTHGSTNG